MVKLNELKKKLIKFRNKRDYLEKQLSFKNIKKIDIINRNIEKIIKKINSVQFGGKEILEDGINHVEIEESDKEEIKTKNDVIEREMREVIKENKEKKEKKSDLKINIPKNKNPDGVILTQISLDFFDKYNSLQKNKDNKIELGIFQNKPEFYDILMNSDNWEDFEKTFKSIFIENSLFFKENIFKKVNENNLTLLIFIIDYFLENNDKENKIKKLKDISIFYPELFNRKVFTNYLFGFIETDVLSNTPISRKTTEKSVKSYEKIGKKMFDIIDIDTKGNIKNTIELTELFPEFIKDEKFCKIIDNTKSIIDIVHLLPYLEEDTCIEINWTDKLESIMTNTNISKDEKDIYLIYFFLGIPELDKIAELLKHYRRKHYNFKLLNSLLNILNFDKRFSQNIKDKNVVKLFEERVLKLRENKLLKDELWFWLLNYCITFNINEKYYYFEVLGNYFRLVPKISFVKKILTNKVIDLKINKKKNIDVKINKDIRNLKDLYLKENIKFILSNYKNMVKTEKLPDIFKQFAIFINTNRKHFNDIIIDKKLNSVLYNLVLENKFEGFKTINMKITNENLKPLLKIKFQSKMNDKLDKKQLKKQISIIEKINSKSEVKKLRVDFYMLIKNELDSNIFKNILFFDNIRIEPNIFIMQYIDKLENNNNKEEKDNKELLKEQNRNENIDFANKTFSEKYNYLQSKLKSNKERLKIIEEDIQIENIRQNN